MPGASESPQLSMAPARCTRTRRELSAARRTPCCTRTPSNRGAKHGRRRGLAAGLAHARTRLQQGDTRERSRGARPGKLLEPFQARRSAARPDEEVVRHAGRGRRALPRRHRDGDAGAAQPADASPVRWSATRPAPRSAAAREPPRSRRELLAARRAGMLEARQTARQGLRYPPASARPPRGRPRRRSSPPTSSASIRWCEVNRRTCCTRATLAACGSAARTRRPVGAACTRCWPRWPATARRRGSTASLSEPMVAGRSR